MHHEDIRHQVRDVMKELKKPMVMPEEIVHYSEWIHAVRDRIAAKQTLDFSNIAVAVHPACHYYKLVQEDAIYDPAIFTAGSARQLCRQQLWRWARKCAIIRHGSTAAVLVFVTFWFNVISPAPLLRGARLR